MKKTFIVLAIALPLTLCTIALAADKMFPDVVAGSYYADAVNNLANMGIIQGYPNGNFGPADKVDRAQLATILDRYDREVVEPVRWQLAVFHKKGRMDLKGKSWDEYNNEYSYYHLDMSLGGEGEPPYNPEIDYFNSVPDGWAVAYDGTNVVDGTAYGLKIIAMDDYRENQETWFYIWIKSEMGLDGTYGFFYDDVQKLIQEAQAS
jgi:hypothetical protein